MSNQNNQVHQVPKFEIIMQAMNNLINILEGEIEAIHSRNFGFITIAQEEKEDLTNFLYNQRNIFSTLRLEDFYSPQEIASINSKNLELLIVAEKNSLALQTASILNRQMIETINRAIEKLAINGFTYNPDGSIRKLAFKFSYGFSGEI